MEQSTRELSILRVLLACAGLGWLISVAGVFMPWSFVSEQLEGLGAQPLPLDPMLNYWLRMTAGAFTCIGLFFFLLALKPIEFARVIPWAAAFLLFEGVLLLITSRLLRLPPLPSLFDAAFCLLIGSGIFVSCYAANRNALRK